MSIIVMFSMILYLKSQFNRNSMVSALQAVGLKVITGASGDAEKVTFDYLNGQLVTSSIGCNHGCGEHEHPGHEVLISLKAIISNI